MLSRVEFYNGSSATFTISSDNIRGGVNYEHNINPDTDLTVGSTSSAKVTFVMDVTSMASPQVPSLGHNFIWLLKQQDESGYRNMGRFVVDSIEKEANDRYKITGYDYLSKFDKDVREWIMATDETGVAPLNYSTVSNLYTGLCTQCGVTYESATFTNSDIAITQILFGGNTISARTILGYIAAVAGAYIYADYAGKICIKHFKGSSASEDVSLNNTKYKSVVAADYNAPAIQKIKVGNADESEVGIVVPSQPAGDSALIIPYNAIFFNIDSEVTEAKVGNIWDIVRYYSYRPMTIELLRDYGINVGDKVKVDVYNHNTNTSTTYYTYIFSKTISATGVTLQSTANSTRDLNTDLGNDEVQQLVGKYNIVKNTVDKHSQTLGDLATGHETKFVIDANGVYISNQDGSETRFDGGHIYPQTIVFNSLDSNTQTKINEAGKIYRQNTYPTVAQSTTGAYWYVTSAVSGHDEYTPGCWYTYNGTTWELTSNPNYITSTKITSTTIESPTIIGNDIIVRGDNDGAFRIQTTVDGEPVDLGRMGAGTQVVDGEVQQGIIISNNTDYGEGTMTEVGDNWVSIVPGEVRMCYSWYEGQGESRIARYRSIFIDADGAWYDDGMGEVSPIGPAVFL